MLRVLAGVVLIFGVASLTLLPEDTERGRALDPVFKLGNAEVEREGDGVLWLSDSDGETVLDRVTRAGGGAVPQKLGDECLTYGRKGGG